MQSILQKDKRCYLSGATDGLDKHHIYGAANRKISESNGFWVWLRHDRHIAESPWATPHNCREVDLMLKKECQKKFEESHTREEFMALIGRNYLED